LAAATILAGLMLRLVPMGLPFAVVKWGGSVLWAWMVYWLFAAALPLRRTAIVALVACGFAALVELSRLYHSPGLDWFRLTLAGKLLLGRVFSGWHFLVYWIAIAVVALIDSRFVRDPRSRVGERISGAW
jgi:hypothetical protein